jgi:UDP-N-acetyl-D-glucosamine dehydrogenase
MPAYVVQRIAAALNDRGLPVNGARVFLLGLAYKADTGDTRHAPALTIARLLSTMGAQIHVADPYTDDLAELTPHTHIAHPTAPDFAASDVVVLLTDHTAFDLQLIEQHAPYVLDCRARLNGPNIERM